MDRTNDLTRLSGALVVDMDGGTVGTVREVYVDDATGQPEWVTVHTGVLGASESFVPLAQAEISDDVVRVAYSKKVVKGSPRLGASDHLGPEQEQELSRYYALVPWAAGPTVVGGPSGAGAEPGGAEAAGATGSAGPADPAVDEVTVSQERLVVGTERHGTERVRLRKHLVTGTASVQVTVRREEVRLEEVPASGTGMGPGEHDDGPGVPYDGPAVDVSPEQPVVVLHEERPVVTTEAVPVERVRLVTDQVVTTETVGAEVRTEHVDLDTDLDTDGEDRPAGG